jgi:predicted metal-dependent phosphoesterase TrpH
MVSFDTAGGAKFYKVDLHIHTPGSHDYEDTDADPDDLVARFKRENLDLVAVTDHNTGEYFERLQEAAEESSVTVLPGVEITTGQSGEHQIHMTAIFPPEEAMSFPRSSMTSASQAIRRRRSLRTRFRRSAIRPVSMAGFQY